MPELSQRRQGSLLLLQVLSKKISHAEAPRENDTSYRFVGLADVLGFDLRGWKESLALPVIFFLGLVLIRGFLVGRSWWHVCLARAVQKIVRIAPGVCVDAEDIAKLSLRLSMRLDTQTMHSRLSA